MLGFNFSNSKESAEKSYSKALSLFQKSPGLSFVEALVAIGASAAREFARLAFANKVESKTFLRQSIKLPRPNYEALRNLTVLVVTNSQSPRDLAHNKAFYEGAQRLFSAMHLASVKHVSFDQASVIAGSRRLSNIVDQMQSKQRRLLLVSNSFGSASTRVMADSMDDSALASLLGWVNIGGLINGSPQFHCSDQDSKIRPQAEALRSHSSEQSFFRRPMNLATIPSLHFLGFAPSESLWTREGRRYHSILSHGPNDGYIPYDHYRLLNQPVIPVHGFGHHIPFAAAREAIFGFLSSLSFTSRLASPSVDIQKSKSFVKDSGL